MSDIQQLPPAAQPAEQSTPSASASPAGTSPSPPPPQAGEGYVGLPKQHFDLLANVPPHYTPQGFSVGSAVWNVSLLFLGTKVIRLGSGNFGTVDVPEAVVMLSWEQAKALASSLQSTVKHYEETQCQINMPKVFLDAVEQQNEDKENKDAK